MSTLTMMIALSDHDGLSTTEDGLTWVGHPGPQTGSLTGGSAYASGEVIYDPAGDRLIFIGNMVAVNNRALTAGWTRYALPSANFGAAAWSPTLGIFVASDSGTGHLWSSPDLQTWTDRGAYFYNADYDYTGALVRILWIKELGLFVAAGGSNGHGNPLPMLITSPDGINWTSNITYSTTTGLSNWINDMAWSPTLGLLVVVGNGAIASSPDGINWTNRLYDPGGYGIANVCWNPEKAEFALKHLNYGFTTSSDGITWTSTGSSPQGAILAAGLGAYWANSGRYYIWKESTTGTTVDSEVGQMLGLDTSHSMFAVRRIDYPGPPPPLIKHSESFEAGTVNGIVGKDNTTFYEVNSLDLNNTTVTEAERNTVRFTRDAAFGNYAATIPPELVTASAYNGDNQYLPLTWLGGDGTRTGRVIDGPHEFEWYFKYVKSMGDFSGRYLYELSSDAIGNPITDVDGYPLSGAWYTGVEVDYNTAAPGNPQAVVWDQQTAGVSGLSQTFTPPPQGTWLKVNVYWEGTSVRTVISNKDTAAVYYDFTEPVTLPNQGFSYINVYLSTTRYSSDPTRDCQFWIDGFSAAPPLPPRHLYVCDLTQGLLRPFANEPPVPISAG